MKKLLTLFFSIFISANVYANDLTIILSSESDGHTTNARIFGKYLTKYISSETNVIFKVVPGAAGMNAANYIYNVAPKDGNTIGILFKNIPIVGAIGGSNVHFDARNFFWLGSVIDGRDDVVVLVSNKPYDGKELIVGAESVYSADPLKFIEEYSNIKIKKVIGYKSSNIIRLAYEKKEVDAFVASLQGIKTFNIDWLKTERFLIQMGGGNKRHPELPNTPTMFEILKDKKDIELLSVFETQFALLRPFVAPPGIPEEKKRILLNAFNKAVSDPEYILAAKKIKLDINPIYHDEAKRIVELTYSASREMLDKIK